MKNKTGTLFCLLIFLNGLTALAQQEPLLGKSHFSTELDAMVLQHRTFDTDDGGVYFGVAGAGHLRDNWYLGGAIGVGSGFGLFLSESSTYMPIELNAKRAFALSRRWIVDLGAGLSYNRIEYSRNSLFSDNDFEIKDWVFGGQAVGDLFFKAGRVLLGLKLKYQLTADVPEVAAAISPVDGWDYSNFKIGFQIGFHIPD